MSDIDIGVLNAKVVSFAYDTRLYPKISYVEDCDSLQSDLNLGVWFHQFLSDMTQFVRLPGGVSKDSPVLSGVPQGTVLGPLLFIIMIYDINKDILSSKIINFADDTRVYTNITQIEL